MNVLISNKRQARRQFSFDEILNLPGLYDIDMDSFREDKMLICHGVSGFKMAIVIGSNNSLTPLQEGSHGWSSPLKIFTLSGDTVSIGN